MVFGKKNQKVGKDIQEKETVNEQDSVDYKDLYLRTTADFQNYKRRVEKERALWIQEAQAETLKPLLSIVDDLERAIHACKHHKEDKTQKDWLEGLQLIYKNVTKIFVDLGVKEINCFGMFDPALHEALMQVDSTDHKQGEIVKILNKGYTFHDNVLRHAKVSVAK